MNDRGSSLRRVKLRLLRENRVQRVRGVVRLPSRGHTPTLSESHVCLSQQVLLKKKAVEAVGALPSREWRGLRILLEPSPVRREPYRVSKSEGAVAALVANRLDGSYVCV